MLSALELLHYSRKFRDSLFVFSCRDPRHCSELLTDIRVLRSAGIKQVLFCAPDDHLSLQIESWNKSGETFSIIPVDTASLRDGRLSIALRRELGKGLAPFVSMDSLPSSEGEWIEFEGLVVQCAALLSAKKVFFPGVERGVEIEGKFTSYPSISFLRDAQRSGVSSNLPWERIEAFVSSQERFGIDLVLVEARRGAVYEEVFTHGGSGTLFTQEYPNILRKAQESDVRDIMALMQPYITEGSLKAVSEDELLKIIRSFMVYSVNDQLVASAALIEYGGMVELAKLCTLPRFQARGRARELVKALLEEGRARGMQGVFALTVNDYVGAFFERLGFSAVPRETLPQEWKDSYDFSRPSKAYLYPL